MKDCAVFIKELCIGCVGLAERDWRGPEQCSIYKKLNNTSRLEICKKILEGEQQKI